MRVEFLHIVDQINIVAHIKCNGKFCKGNYGTEYWILHVTSSH